MEVIQMKDVSFHYTGDVPILENVNICLNSGDYAILTGENGSGKSTFLKLLLGELEPDQGTVEIFGKKIGKADFKELKIGYVPQNSIGGNKDFPATVEEVMMTGLYRPFKKRLSRKANRRRRLCFTGSTCESVTEKERRRTYDFDGNTWKYKIILWSKQTF